MPSNPIIDDNENDKIEKSCVHVSNMEWNLRRMLCKF